MNARLLVFGLVGHPSHATRNRRYEMQVGNVNFAYARLLLYCFFSFGQVVGDFLGGARVSMLHQSRGIVEKIVITCNHETEMGWLEISISCLRRARVFRRRPHREWPGRWISHGWCAASTRIRIRNQTRRRRLTVSTEGHPVKHQSLFPNLSLLRAQ